MKLFPYLEIARPDHWFKNIFMLPGMLLYFYFHPESPPKIGDLPTVLIAVAATCLIASSYYILNELLDAPRDLHHPVKKHRPVPSGKVKLRPAYALFLLCGLAGLGLGALISTNMVLALGSLWAAGLAYNIPPVRTKDKPYLDVLSEAVNNPLRMLLGWYSVGQGAPPPLSALLAYWMFGAFLMAIKRMAEYREIDNKEIAAAYRSSFAYYTAERLMVSILYYATAFGLLSGYFIARYKLELILAFPLVAYTMAYYFHIGFKKDSPVQNPEKLYKKRKLMLCVGITFLVCTLLLFVHIPPLSQALSPQIPPPTP
jgi:4-hydroxybenzoate polyprenyltransferase